MSSAATKLRWPGFLANCCMFAGLALFLHDSVAIPPFMLPMNELTRADFLIAAGMIPPITLAIAAFANLKLP